MYTSKILALVLLGAALCVGARAEDSKIKETAKEVGHATGTAAREIGQGTKKVAKDVGKAVTEAARETGHAFSDGAKEFKKAVQSDGTKPAATEVKKKPPTNPKT